MTFHFFFLVIIAMQLLSAFRSCILTELFLYRLSSAVEFKLLPHVAAGFVKYDVKGLVDGMQNGHEGCSNEGNHCNTRHADQRLHMQVLLGQRDGLVVWVTERTNQPTEFSLPTSGTGKLHLHNYTGLPLSLMPSVL